MKVIVIGSGRMGTRHIEGILSVDFVTRIVVTDISESSLNNAKESLKDKKSYDKCSFVLLGELDNTDSLDVAIIASTANDRAGTFDLLNSLGCRHVMVEKPLGQSYEEVTDFNNKVSESKIKCCVNLNMRLYDSFIKLKNDLASLPQLKGNKMITVNTGTIGIGANGIHYLDLLFFLLGADEARISAAHIDEKLIPSGRGGDFGDFGGWSVIDFYKENSRLGTALLSLGSGSTVFGSWEIVAPHGRIYFNEVEQKRVNTYRKEDSTLPVNRYFGDYLHPIEEKIESPFLGNLTAKWLIGLEKGEQLLPSIEESLKVHKLMFDWLNHSKTHQNRFPIT